MTREEAIKWLIKPARTSTDIGEIKEREIEAYNMAIEALSVDRPNGEWISNHDGSWNCSECGLRVFIYAKGNYCPNCGARMKGGVE